MKTCPVCRKTYNDDSLAFCLDDGSPLVAADNLSEPETVVGKRESSATSHNFGQLPESSRPPKSNTGLIIGVTVCAVLLMSMVGVAAAYFIFMPAGTGDANSNQRNNSSINSSRNASLPVNGRETTDLQNSPVERINTNRATIPAPNQNSSREAEKDAPPQIIASASSVRKAMQGNFYFPNFAFDGNPATAWCEGAPGAGEGEWLRFDFDRPVNLRQIKIQPGYFKNDESWRKNNRAARLSLQCSDGTSRAATNLRDEMTTQTIDVNCSKTGWVKITIDDYYPGESDSQDTLISEVSFVTEP